MKRKNIFKSAGSLLMAGVFATTFIACDSDERKSTAYEGAEEQYETTETGLNEPTIGYEDGEYELDREYAYEDRELVSNRLRDDIDRTDRTLEEMERDMERQGKEMSAEARREWEESKQKLETERQRLNQRLEEVENSTEANWERVRNDVNTTLRDWEREWEELKKKDVDVDVNVRDNENQ